MNDALDVQKDTHRFLNENAMHFSEPEAPRFEIYEGDDVFFFFFFESHFFVLSHILLGITFYCR